MYRHLKGIQKERRSPILPDSVLLLQNHNLNFNIKNIAFLLLDFHGTGFHFKFQ